jgi:hypothetical protein
LNLNLILHQDGTGQVRLLKQAIVMYRDPTYNPDGTRATNGRYAVLTNDKLIPNYSGVTLRDNEKVGRRLSAVAFDYSPSADTDFEDTALRCSGVISAEVVCEMILESSAGNTHPANPFLHRFHPDHDNAGSDYKTFSPEVNRIKRVITLSFDPTPKKNPDNPPPGWGVSLLHNAGKRC